jgi:hypothetical protein
MKMCEIECLERLGFSLDEMSETDIVIRIRDQAATDATDAIPRSSRLQRGSVTSQRRRTQRVGSQHVGVYDGIAEGVKRIRLIRDEGTEHYSVG